MQTPHIIRVDFLVNKLSLGWKLVLVRTRLARLLRGLLLLHLLPIGAGFIIVDNVVDGIVILSAKSSSGSMKQAHTYAFVALSSRAAI